MSICGCEMLNYSLCILSSLTSVWLDGFGFSYEWFVPVTWIKPGRGDEQYWLLTKEGNAYHRSRVNVIDTI